MSKLGTFTDGTLKSEFYIEDDIIHRRVTDVHEQAILNRNAELRKNPGVIDHMGFAGLELTIPESHYYRLLVKYPDLGSHDAEIKRKAWLRFLKTPESQPYKVR